MRMPLANAREANGSLKVETVFRSVDANAFVKAFCFVEQISVVVLVETESQRNSAGVQSTILDRKRDIIIVCESGHDREPIPLALELGEADATQFTLAATRLRQATSGRGHFVLAVHSVATLIEYAYQACTNTLAETRLTCIGTLVGIKFFAFNVECEHGVATFGNQRVLASF